MTSILNRRLAQETNSIYLGKSPWLGDLYVKEMDIESISTHRMSVKLTCLRFYDKWETIMRFPFQMEEGEEYDQNLAREVEVDSADIG